MKKTILETTSKEDIYYCFKNPIIRMPDNRSINKSQIMKIRQVFDRNEIFRR